MKSNIASLSPEEQYAQHANLLVHIGNELLAPEGKRFEIGENGEILRFLLYYFNRLPEAENIIPHMNYKLHKNLLVCGQVGVGKTFLFRLFAEYLKRINSPYKFVNTSVTQLINYYKIHNHLDRYTYNEEDSRNFEGNPFNICINDVGLMTHKHFGTDTKTLITDLFHARIEIWDQYRVYTHITTNLDMTRLIDFFKDDYGRMTDRFKFYNVIFLKGESKR